MKPDIIHIAALEAKDARIKELEEENQSLREGLQNLLFASENADETGYIDGEGWIDLEKLQTDARAILAKRATLSQLMSIVGSCTCLTKTPSIQYHAEDCRYRMLMENTAKGKDHS